VFACALCFKGAAIMHLLYGVFFALDKLNNQSINHGEEEKDG
jgi:hypothetical protein